MYLYVVSTWGWGQEAQRPVGGIPVAWLQAGNLLPRHMLMVYAPLAAWFFFSGPGRYSLDGWLAGRRAGRVDL